MSGLGRRVAALERAQVVDIEARVRHLAAQFGVDPAAAVAEARRAVAELERHGRAGATKRWADDLGLTVPAYRAQVAALARHRRANDGRTV